MLTDKRVKGRAVYRQPVVSFGSRSPKADLDKPIKPNKCPKNCKKAIHGTCPGICEKDYKQVGKDLVKLVRVYQDLNAGV